MAKAAVSGFHGVQKYQRHRRPGSQQESEGGEAPPVTEEEKPSQLSAKQQGETKAAGGQLIP